MKSQAPTGTAPQCGGWSGTQDYWSAAYPALQFNFNYPVAADFAVARTWLGLVAGGTTSATMEATDTAGVNFAGIRYSTVAGDTHFMCVAATASGQTAVDTGITPAAATTYMTEIDMNASSVVCTINGAVTTNSGAYQPGAVAGTLEEMYINAYPSGTTQVQIGIGGMKGWEQGRNY